MLDRSTAVGGAAEARLNSELAIWLTTVSPSGRPRTSPVWFRWDGSTFLIYSQPDAEKVRNIASNPRVSLHLDGDRAGGEVVIIEGTAGQDPETGAATGDPEYLEKYRKGIEDLGMTPEGFVASYAVPIRITPTGFRIWD